MNNLLFILLLGLGFSQTELTTRMFEMNVDIPINEYIEFDLEEITGYYLEEATFYIVSVNVSPNTQLYYGCSSMYGDILLETNGNNVFYQHYNTINNYKSDDDCVIYNLISSVTDASFKIAVTAEFPEEDTGYIEDGFQFCLHSGANLVSYPCDNPVPVGQSLPSGIENFVTDIIGEGEATTYNSSLGWIGSLSSFTEGGGYWFKSNSDVCFEYECVAD